MTMPRLKPERLDAELVERVAAGELEALGSLFDRHEAGMRRFFLRMGIAASDVDDLVQATFLELLRAAPRFQRDLSVRSWLLGLSAIMARRHRRALARAAARLLGWATWGRLESPLTPADALNREQELLEFQAAFQRLAPKKREVFTLVVLEGLSGEEAAGALGVPVNTVWTRLHHARRELREALKETR
jgi:RNA polymerase sigma factor (sigma-70 family)